MVVTGIACGVAAGVRASTRITAFTVVLAASLLAVVAPAQAAGDLDASFSGDGKQTTDFGDWDYAQAVAIQGDGRIVVAGGSGANFALARYNADGSLDSSFSGDGKLTDSADSFDGRSVAIQSDGRILVAGGSGADLALARYNADGSPDTSFSGDGRVTTDLGGTDSGQAVAIQSDGTIVVAGSTGADFALARYLPDGSPDSSFSDDGKVTTDLGGSDYGQSVAVQADGRIVVAGGSDGDKFALARYHASGSPDTSLSGDGTVRTGLGGQTGRAAAIQADGSIVVVGAINIVPTAEYEFPHDDLALTRYTADGALDTSFGAGGRQTTDFGFGYAANDIGTAAAIQADGKIVVAGWSSLVDWVFSSGRDFALARYNTNGSPDTSFGVDGRLTSGFFDVYYDADDFIQGVAIQPDGKIVVAGGTTGEDWTSDVALARYEGGAGASEPGTSPTNLNAPTIAGGATEGQTLTVNAGTWSGSSPITLSYQWRRCDSAAGNCVDIAAATATSYPLTAADAGHTIRVRETATNVYGTGSVDSAATAVVKANPGAIAGTVRSASTGGAIASASVTCGTGYSAKTASDGTYSIRDVTAGSYSCTASANRYRASTRTVTVASGQTTTANFSLARR
jgi:uncharacterized delta-60 repeat protein